MIGGVLFSIVKGGVAEFVMPEWGLGSNGWGERYLTNYNITRYFVAETVFACLFLSVAPAVTSSYGNITIEEKRTTLKYSFSISCNNCLWSWRDSNPRPNEEATSFLHAYPQTWFSNKHRIRATNVYLISFIFVKAPEPR